MADLASGTTSIPSWNLIPDERSCNTVGCSHLPRHVGDDEADARIEFAWMPFHFGDYPPRSRPAFCLEGEACVGPARVIRRAANGALEQISDPFLQGTVGGQTDRVFDPLVAGFANPEVYVGGAKIKAQDLALITRNDRLLRALPTIGAADVAGTKRAPFEVAELVKTVTTASTARGRLRSCGLPRLN
jgi:hypothetical protein